MNAAGKVKRFHCAQLVLYGVGDSVRGPVSFSTLSRRFQHYASVFGTKPTFLALSQRFQHSASETAASETAYAEATPQRLQSRVVALEQIVTATAVPLV